MDGIVFHQRLPLLVFFNKFTLAVNDRVFPPLFKHLFSFIEAKDVILDIDSHVIPRYGSVEGAEVGYN